MNRKNLLILIILFVSKSIYAQDFLVLSPQQLGIGTSTARVGNWVYAGSALAQSFYSNQSRATLSLYVPYTQLTDGKMQTSSFQFYSPSYKWGAVSIGYADYSVDNFDKQVMGVSSFQFGYTNVFLNRFIIATQLKWQQQTWHSDWQDPLKLDGTSLDLSAIYILSGYSSVGISISNVLRQSYSSVENDASPREVRIGYSWLDNSLSSSVEGGVVAGENAFFDPKYGGYINSEINLPFGFRLGAEYKRLFYNELGAVLSFNYVTDNFNTEISYGIRVDDSPMPISTLQHSWGLHLTLNQFKPEKSVINPQIMFRDVSPPKIYVERLSEYSLFMRSDETDIFKLHTRLTDNESGVDSVNFSIVSAGDTTNVLYSEQFSISENIFADTILFDGYSQEGEFFKNGRYLTRVTAVDAVGNESTSNYIPFRVLSKRNDSAGPEVSISFDTSELILEASESTTMLSANVSVNDNEGDWVLWKVQLHKMRENGTWKGLKPANGGVEIEKRKFSWLLKNSRSRPIQGQYKILAEAYDELNNSSLLWSAVKTVIQPEPEPEPGEELQESTEGTKPVIEDRAIPTVVYIPQEIEPAVKQDRVRQFSIEASYFYRDREVKLSDFTFIEGQKFNAYSNQQSLSVIGVYLQDLPKAKLVIDYSKRLKDVAAFESELRNFLKEAYNIENTRVVFRNNSQYTKLRFFISE